MSLAGPLSPRGVPIDRGPRAAFDMTVRQILARLQPAFDSHLDDVNVVIDEVPLLPPNWTDPIPHSAVSHIHGGFQIVIYRIPLTAQEAGKTEIEELLWAVLLERLGEVWNRRPEDLDPRGYN